VTEPGSPLPFHLRIRRRSWSTPRVLNTGASWKEGGSSSRAKPCDGAGWFLAGIQRWPGPDHFRDVKEVITTLSLKECLTGLWHWPKYRLLGHCWAEGCGRPMILHSPWALYICERTPMGITLTEKGEALYRELAESAA
jgi:hypothetical protein